MQMGGGGDEDAVETHNAEELTDETFEERLLEYEVVRRSFARHSPPNGIAPLSAACFQSSCASMRPTSHPNLLPS